MREVAAAEREENADGRKVRHMSTCSLGLPAAGWKGRRSYSKGIVVSMGAATLTRSAALR